MKEKCRACKRDIEKNITHAGLCNECMWMKRKPIRTITRYKTSIAEVKEIY